MKNARHWPRSLLLVLGCILFAVTQTCADARAKVIVIPLPEDADLALLTSAMGNPGVSATGDLNDDGSADLAVRIGGKVGVYWGPIGTGAWDVSVEQPDVLLNIPDIGANVGSNSLLIDDLNDDGVDDLMGAGQLFFGGSAFGTTTQPDVILTGFEPGDDERIAGVADLNADGASDMIIAAPGADGEGSELCPYFGDFGTGERCGSGVVHVVFGPWTVGQLPNVEEPDVVVHGAATGDTVATVVATGDVNDDEIEDLVMGAAGHEGPNGADGALWVLYGSTLLNGVYDLAVPQAVDLAVYGEAATVGLFSVDLKVGDLNGDGTDDIMAGARLTDPAGRVNAGIVHVIFGSSSLPQSIALGTTPADVTIFGDVPNGQFGATLAIGDTNGDGYVDLLVHADTASYATPFSGEASAYLVLGGPYLPRTLDARTAGIALEYRGVSTNRSIDDIGSGDVNGDGASDLFLRIERSTLQLDLTAFFGSQCVFGSSGEDDDRDGLTNGEESSLNTNGCSADTDRDGCSDGQEMGANANAGGMRDPTNFWDFYDATGDEFIDLGDTLVVLTAFGSAGDGVGNLLDRQASNASEPWRTDEANDGVDLIDALASLKSFGHSCSGPP